MNPPSGVVGGDGIEKGTSQGEGTSKRHVVEEIEEIEGTE